MPDSHVSNSHFMAGAEMTPFRFLCPPLETRFCLAKSCERMHAILPRVCGQCPGPRKLTGRVSAAERKQKARERVKGVCG